MAFVNEVVSDADIDKYGLPFKKGIGLYWTRDAERDVYLWGGLSGNPAHGEEINGEFYLYIDGQVLYFVIRPGAGSIKFSESPYHIVWDSVQFVRPSDYGGLEIGRVNRLLKDALLVYGRNGGSNQYTPCRRVTFGF
jgi:hypothetical protein